MYFWCYFQVFSKKQLIINSLFSVNCKWKWIFTALLRDSSQQNQNFAHYALHRSMSPKTPLHKKISKSCVLSKKQHRTLKSHAYIQYKVTLQIKSKQTSGSKHKHGYICLPTCSPRLLRMLDSSMVQHCDFSCLPPGVKPRCTAWLQPPAHSLLSFLPPVG